MNNHTQLAQYAGCDDGVPNGPRSAVSPIVVFGTAHFPRLKLMLFYFGHDSRWRTVKKHPRFFQCKWVLDVVHNDFAPVLYGGQRLVGTNTKLRANFPTIAGRVAVPLVRNGHPSMVARGGIGRKPLASGALALRSRRVVGSKRRGA